MTTNFCRKRCIATLSELFDRLAFESLIGLENGAHPFISENAKKLGFR